MSEALTERERQYLQSLAQWVKEQVALGRAYDQIVTDLARSGLDRDTALALLNAVVRPAPPQPSRLVSILSTVGGWVLIGVVFLFANVVLYVVQEWYHADEVRTCERIKQDLSLMDREIASIQRTFEQRERARAEIEELEATLKQGANAFGTRTAYLSTYGRYSRLLDDYNARVEATNKLITRYKTLIDDYNSKVEQYNKLTRTAYSRWYLIPVPRGSGKALNKRSHLP